MEPNIYSQIQRLFRPMQFEPPQVPADGSGVTLTVAAGHVTISFPMGFFDKMNVYARRQGEDNFILAGESAEGSFTDPRPVRYGINEVRQYLLKGCKDGTETSQPGHAAYILLPGNFKSPFSNKPVVRAYKAGDHIRIEWLIPSGYRMNIYTRKDDETDFVLLAHNKANAFKDYRPLQKPNVSETRHYQLALVTNGVEICNYGGVLTAVSEPLYAGLVAFRPLVKMKLSPKFVCIHFLPTRLKVKGRNIYRRNEGETEFTFLAFTSASVFKDPRVGVGQAQAWEYQFAGVVDKQEIGLRTHTHSVANEPLLEDYRPDGWLKVTRGNVRINIKYYPGLGMNVYSRRDTEKDFTLLGYAKRSILMDRRRPESIYQDEVRHYQLVLVADGKETGMRSNLLSVRLKARAQPPEYTNDGAQIKIKKTRKSKTKLQKTK